MDWIRFLDENNIHYITRGPNTKKGEVSIQCPMCGDDDPSEHLGINLNSGRWGCLRDQSHRGKASRTLIKALLHVSSNVAEDVRRQYSRPDPNDLESALEALTGETEDVAKQARKQSCEPEFNDFSQIRSRGLTKKFFTYLQQRGFDNPSEMIERYGLRCALTGRYQNRIILPVSLNGELLGWTSRLVGHSATAPRYLASSEDVKATVYNYDELKDGGDRLFIVEGPFDALRMDNFMVENNYNIGKAYDAEGMGIAPYRVTCTFGTSPTISQLALLRSLVKKYKEAYVLFDKGADGPASNLAEWTGAKLAYLPHNADDPGELDASFLFNAAYVGFDGYFMHYTPVVHAFQLFMGAEEHRTFGRRGRHSHNW